MPQIPNFRRAQTGFSTDTFQENVQLAGAQAGQRAQVFEMAGKAAGQLKEYQDRKKKTDSALTAAELQREVITKSGKAMNDALANIGDGDKALKIYNEQRKKIEEEVLAGIEDEDTKKLVQGQLTQSAISDLRSLRTKQEAVFLANTTSRFNDLVNKDAEIVADDPSKVFEMLSLADQTLDTYAQAKGFGTTPAAEAKRSYRQNLTKSALFSLLNKGNNSNLSSDARENIFQQAKDVLDELGGEFSPEQKKNLSDLIANKQLEADNKELLMLEKEEKKEALVLKKNTRSNQLKLLNRINEASTQEDISNVMKEALDLSAKGQLDPSQLNFFSNSVATIRQKEIDRDFKSDNIVKILSSDSYTDLDNIEDSIDTAMASSNPPLSVESYRDMKNLISTRNASIKSNPEAATETKAALNLLSSVAPVDPISRSILPNADEIAKRRGAQMLTQYTSLTSGDSPLPPMEAAVTAIENVLAKGNNLSTFRIPQVNDLIQSAHKNTISAADFKKKALIRLNIARKKKVFDTDNKRNEKLFNTHAKTVNIISKILEMRENNQGYTDELNKLKNEKAVQQMRQKIGVNR